MKKILSLVFVAIFSGFIAAATNINPVVPFAGIILLSQLVDRSQLPTGSFLMAFNPDISALAAYAGKYEQALFRTLYNALDAAREILVYPNVKNSINLTKLKVNNGPKPYTGVFNSRSNDLVYTGTKLTAELAQRDIEIEPKKFQQTFMAERMGAGSGASNQNIPFAQYVWESVLGQMAADINDKVIYEGLDKADFVAWDNGTIYNAGDLVTYTQSSELRYFKCLSTTVAAESPDTTPAKWQDVSTEAITKGFKDIIADAITASSLSPVTTGAIDNSTNYALASYRKVFRNLPVAYKRAGVNMYCSFTDFEFLLDDIEDKVAKYNREDVSGIMFLPGTDRKCRVVPASWMSNTRRLVSTPRENMLMGVDRMSDLNDINTVPGVYTLQSGITFTLGLAVRDFDAMRVSDQA